MEVYAAGAIEDFESLIQLIAETSGVPRADFEAYLYRRSGAEAAVHLCRVAAGLDSMILGEPQILGQVTDAYETAQLQGVHGPVVSALFRAAIRAGKRARTETGISRNPTSVSAVAAKLAQSIIPNLGVAQVLVIGAGEMAELAVEALRARGAQHLAVAARIQERAEQLAGCGGGVALTFANLVEGLSIADIVISSTSAPHFVVTPERVSAAMSQRPQRPLVFIDIAVPRDVAPEVAMIPNIYCYDIDDLQSQLDEAMAEREQEAPKVETIVAEETAAFANWLRGLEVTPLISTLRAKADAIRQAEVEKALRQLPELGEAERRQIEVLAESLVNKLLHEPTRRLKAEAGNGHAAEYAAMARYLFGLEG